MFFMKLLSVFLLLVLLCGWIALSAQQKIYLVSVGVADYPGTNMDLTLPAKDAETINWLYQKNSKAQCVLLTNAQATRKNVLNKMEETFGKAQSNDIVVFFFSGHGYKGGFVAYDGYLTYEDIQKVMSKCKANNKMVFADACFAGKIRSSKRDNTPSLSQIMLFLSSRGNETSLENRSMKNGYFTSCLQRGLRGGADKNHDRTITARELFEFVSEAVKTMTRDKQHPVMWGKFNHSMPVMVW